MCYESIYAFSLTSHEARVLGGFARVAFGKMANALHVLHCGICSVRQKCWRPWWIVQPKFKNMPKVGGLVNVQLQLASSYVV